MIVWRISNYDNLLGLGGLYAGGRWHSKGRLIVYTSEHPALAILEVLAHLDRTAPPADYQLLSIELPNDSVLEHLGHDFAPDKTKATGDNWLASGSSLALRVPSVVAAHSWNYLINPMHPRFSLAAIVSVERWPFDPRIIA